MSKASEYEFVPGEYGKVYEAPIPPVCLSPLGVLRAAREKPFVKSAREQYEDADRKRTSRVLLKRWARFGAFALDEVKKELEEMKEKGFWALSPYPSDPDGYERQVLFSMQLGLFYLCFQREEELESL